MRYTAHTTALALAALLLTAGAQAQNSTGFTPDAPQALDPRVAPMLADVSADRIEATIRKLAAFGTRHTASETASETRGIGAARRWIEQQLKDCAAKTGGRLQVTMDSFIEPPGPRLTQATELVNVVATLPGASAGTPRERILVVSGHYDSRNSDVMDAKGEAPGANDDASGTAAVMEMACAMAKQRFDATLVFMAVPGEEQGLLGARHWARRARAQGLNVEAMITNDIIGSSRGDAGQHDPKRLRLFADGFDPLLRLLVNASTNTPASEDEIKTNAAIRAQLQPLAVAGGSEDLPTQQFGRHLKAQGERYLPGFSVDLIQRRDRYLRGGDHLPFLERGYAAVRFSEPFENFQHQHQNLRTENGVVYGDLTDFVDFAYVADVARINLAGLATLAWAPAPVQGARIDARELTNDTTLQWTASQDPDLAGYRIVWRRSESQAWEGAKSVGNVTRVTLPLSKDNLIFGIQAVSKSGHAGLASYPLPLAR
ncbi:M20/M25/M40 family metallo-hydrolase [Roseateles amylovorans]|uniref:M20/M25/M40 family metallo-hydrolase n=1 Tax=Roseateles amylovorans TaxID=2978473 RepID=A0ABY6B115_9BURK|nr:M20/M25/M40 family metallo-hydrolase [Roseateles amylovorans]UXH78877.1 M20/M25/M40 family metallo-hydrolase [Roseateles amylovorans]